MKYSILCFIACILFACEEPAEEVSNVPEDKRLILINGFLSPEEEIIKVEVSKTISSFDQLLENQTLNLVDKLVIKDAIVTIKNENEEESELIYSNENKVYQIDASKLLIQPGNEYNLKVIVGDNEFTATCKIPENAITAINTTIGLKTDELGNIKENLSVSFKDIEEENNFYVVGALYDIIGITSENSLIADFDTGRFVSDVNGDGLSISSDGTITNINENLEITVKVANVDENIFTTLKSVFLNEYQKGNPFFQPIIPPNNIEGEGGYGVFAGFRLFEKTITHTPN